MMSVKRKNRFSMNPYSDHSWEEQAFAEDARGGLLGGFVWPPRSYSCGFCRREFKSAQALGGHMNVHRREKAKLKQSVNGNEATVIAPLNHNQESVCEGSLDPAGLFPSRVSSIPALGQESLDSSSETKSCVYDEDLVVINHGNGDVETNLVLGFDLDHYYCLHMPMDVGGCKWRKSNPTILQGGIDLELRLASFYE